MRRLIVWAAVLLAGCSGEARTGYGEKTATQAPALRTGLREKNKKPEPERRKAGDKVVIASIQDVHSSLVILRDSRKKANARPKGRPPGLAGMVWPGDLVEVLEVGEDFVSIDMVRDRFGDPKELHGFVDKEDFLNPPDEKP